MAGYLGPWTPPVVLRDNAERIAFCKSKIAEAVALSLSGESGYSDEIVRADIRYWQYQLEACELIEYAKSLGMTNDADRG